MEKADEVRARIGDVQATLADRLEESAQRVRRKRGGAAVAPRLERTAMWLRENEIVDLGSLLRQQLRDHPGRTALIALGLGVMIGRASRRD